MEVKKALGYRNVASEANVVNTLFLTTWFLEGNVALEMCFLRSMLLISWTARVTNSGCLEKVSQS